MHIHADAGAVSSKGKLTGSCSQHFLETAPKMGSFLKKNYFVCSVQ